MKIDKLLQKTKAFLSADERKRREKRKFLKQVLKKLKHHEKGLIEKLAAESGKTKRAKIKKEIALTHAQRKKGVKTLEELKSNPKSKKKH